MTQIYCRLSGILWPYWTSNHMTYNCNFKYTIDWNTLTKIELYTKITFWVSIIPKLCLFFILAILIDVHIRFQVMWPLSSFLSASVRRSYSKTWNHTPRSPSWVQWYCFQCWLFWVAAILNFGSRNFKVNLKCTSELIILTSIELGIKNHILEFSNSKVMIAFHFGYHGCRPYWKWSRKVLSQFFLPGILRFNYESFKIIPIFPVQPYFCASTWNIWTF